MNVGFFGENVIGVKEYVCLLCLFFLGYMLCDYYKDMNLLWKVNIVDVVD